MNNCLVTKLKSSVNNESLSKLNVLTIKTKAIDSPTINTQWLVIGASENGSVSINSSNVGLYQSGISGALVSYPYNIPANTHKDTRFENKDGIIEVTGKYNINKIGLGDNAIIRMRDIYGIPATIVYFSIFKASIEEGEIDVTKLCNTFNRSEINIIAIPDNVILINKLSKNTAIEFTAIDNINRNFCRIFDGLGLDDIANNVNINTIQFYDLKGGNLSSLAKLTNLTSVVFSNSYQNNGDIMDFINPWIQAGRTSGKINVKWLLGQQNIMLNGQPITYPEGVTNPDAYLNWTSDGTVTFTAS